MENLIDDSKHKILAVWGPKPGDGTTMVAEAITQMLWEKRKGNERIVLMDYNTRTPNLKYRLGLDDLNILDELLPFISSSKLTPEILVQHAVNIYQKEGVHFLGGIRRPEFNGRYNCTNFNKLLDTVESYYHKTVIDAGNILDLAGTVTALQRADYVLAVLQPSYISKQNLKQSRSFFPSLGINPNKIGIIFNRYRINDEEPKIMARGLDLKVLGILNELDSEKSHLEHSWLINTKEKKDISLYRENLKKILERCNILQIEECKEKIKILPRFFAWGA